MAECAALLLAASCRAGGAQARRALSDAGALRPLVRMLRSAHASQQRAAVEALAAAVEGDDTSAAEVAGHLGADAPGGRKGDEKWSGGAAPGPGLGPGRGRWSTELFLRLVGPGEGAHTRFAAAACLTSLLPWLRLGSELEEKVCVCARRGRGGAGEFPELHYLWRFGDAMAPTPHLCA